MIRQVTFGFLISMMSSCLSTSGPLIDVFLTRTVYVKSNAHPRLRWYKMCPAFHTNWRWFCACSGAQSVHVAIRLSNAAELSWAARPSRHRKNSRRRGGTSLHAVISHAQRHRHYAPFLRCADSPKVQSTFPASDPARRSALDCDVPWSKKPGVRTITPLYNSPHIDSAIIVRWG